MTDNKYEEIPFTIFLMSRLKHLKGGWKENFYGEEYKKGIIAGIEMAIETVNKVDHEMKLWSLSKEGYGEIQP